MKPYPANDTLNTLHVFLLRRCISLDFKKVYIIRLENGRLSFWFLRRETSAFWDLFNQHEGSRGHPKQQGDLTSCQTAATGALSAQADKSRLISKCQFLV